MTFLVNDPIIYVIAGSNDITALEIKNTTRVNTTSFREDHYRLLNHRVANTMVHFIKHINHAMAVAVGHLEITFDLSDDLLTVKGKSKEFKCYVVKFKLCGNNLPTDNETLSLITDIVFSGLVNRVFTMSPIPGFELEVLPATIKYVK